MSARTEALISRLENWKFTTAITYLNMGDESKEAQIIKNLSCVLGNSGWFQGHMGELVEYVVDNLVESIKKKELKP